MKKQLEVGDKKRLELVSPEKNLYLVMRLNHVITIEQTDPFTGEKAGHDLPYLHMPVYETLEEAEEHACNGKYKITVVAAYGNPTPN